MQCPAYAGVVVVVRHKVRQSYISRTIWARITKFYRRIHTELHYIWTGHDVTNYFQSEVTAKTVENTASDGFRWNFSRKVKAMIDRHFTRLSMTSGPTNLPDTTSLVASGRLQNPIKYCTKVMRKTGTAGHIVK